MSACKQGSAASHSGKHPRLRNDRDICCATDRRSPAMPEEYRHQVPPSKHPSAIDRSSVVRESWIVVSPGTMSPDQAQRPSLDTGSIRLVNPLAHPTPQSIQEFRPPPPLIDPNSRTASAGSIPHGASPPTAVMPSNPNYKPVPDLAHNGTTRERPSETPSVHVPATPREAIGHLDASQLHNKEDRESAVLRKRNRGSGMLGAVFGTHEPRSSMEDIDSIHSGVAQERERHSHSFRNFFGTSREREKEKDRQRPVDMNDRAQWDMFHLIGYITSTNVEDWSVVMEVVDKVNQSDSEAREASKALRKDIQFGRPASQLAAARLWAILMRNCLTYFVAQTTNRKFLSKIEEVALNPNTPPVVRDRLVEVVGTSVYLLKESKHLKPYQATWKKLRMQLKLSHPADGLVINADDPILNPTPHRPPSSLRQYPGAESIQPDPPLGVTGVARSIANLEIEPGREPGDLRDEERDRERRRERSRRGEAAYGVISPEEDMRRLFEECDIAHDNCRILADSLVYATPDAVTVDPLIQEFRQKCIRSQEIIGAQIDWASSVAERARAEQMSLVGPGEIVPTTSEEQLLHALVTANGELNDVFKTYDDLERLAISEREEAEVRERSRVELKIDRSKIQMVDGEVMIIPPDNHGPSRSQSHTPAPITVPLPSQTPTRRPLPQPTPSSPAVNSLAPPPPAPHGPRPLSRNRTPSPKLGSDRGYDESSQESDLPPVMPSEKAMGKRKAEPQPEEEDDWPDHNSLLPLDNGNDDDDDDSEPKPQEVFLYDAAEERKKQRAVQGR